MRPHFPIKSKILLILALNLFSAFHLNGQEFIKAFGDVNTNFTWSSTYIEENNSYYVLGNLNDNTPLISRLDKNGNIIWTKKYGSSLLAIDIDHVYIQGQTIPDIIVVLYKAGSARDVHVMRINADSGQLIWSKEYKPATSVRYAHLTVTSTNKIIVNGVNDGNSGMVLFQLDVNGSILWANRYTSPLGQLGSTAKIIADVNGGCINAQRIGSGTCILNLNGDGSIESVKEANIPYVFRTIRRTSNGYLVSAMRDFNARGTNQALIKLDSELNIKFAKNFNAQTTVSSTCGGCDIPTAIENADGNVIYAVESSMSGNISQNILKLNPNGELMEAVTFPVNHTKIFRMISLTNGLFSYLGYTTRSGICLPQGQAGIFGVSSTNINICGTIPFNPKVETLPLTLTEMPPGSVLVASHLVAVNDFTITPADFSIYQAPYCDVPPELEISLGPDINLCESDTINLNIGAGYLGYTWSTGENTPSIIVDEPGKYTVTVNTICGTMPSAQININASEHNSSLLTASICKGSTFNFGNEVLTEAGEYELTLANQAGCDSVIKLSLKIDTVPQLNLNQDTTICTDSSLIIVITLPTGTFYWQDGSSDSIYTINKPGIYTVTSTNECGIKEESINVDFKDCTCADNVYIPAQICFKDYYELPDGEMISDQGTYTVTLQNDQGCDSIITIILSVISIDTAILNLEICDGDSISIGDNVFTSSGVYVIKSKNYFGCDSIVIANIIESPTTYLSTKVSICSGQSYHVGPAEYTTSGIYLDTLKSNSGCDSIIQTFLEVIEPASVIVDTFLCKENFLTINGTIYNLPGNYQSIDTNYLGCDSIIYNIVIRKQWIEDTLSSKICKGDTLLFNNLTITDTGIYFSESTNQFGCKNTRTIIIESAPTPEIQIEVLTLRNSIQLIAQSPSQQLEYIWKSTGSISNNSIYNPIVNITENTWYYLTVIDTNGCKAKDSILLAINDFCGDNSLSIPTAFSPNGDNINDCFKPMENIAIEEYTCTIYNRWGNIVFESNSIDDCWDGSYNSLPAPLDSYLFQISYSCKSNLKYTKVGILLLIR